MEWSFLHSFHFLRPQWLWLFVIMIPLLFLLYRRTKANISLDQVISPHLIPYLLTKASRQHGVFQPLWLLSLLLVLMILALSGPSWSLKPSPFQEDEAALVMVMKVAPSMLVNDVKPDRLQRTVQKIQDLLALRKGARHGLIMYSGSAHMVMPLTTDPNAILYFLQEITPEVMPLEGDNPNKALALADEMLKQDAVGGSIVLFTDSVDQVDLRPEALVINTLHIVPMVQEMAQKRALDKSQFKRVSHQLKANLYSLTADNRDMSRLVSQAKKQWRSPETQPQSQWQDSGYWLTPLIAILLLFWFRPGWLLDYE